MGDVGSPTRRVGVLVGLIQEGEILKEVLGNSAPLIVGAGMQPLGAALATGYLVASGAQTLLSFGFAGGLDRMLKPGDIVIACRVIGPNGTQYEADAALRQRLSEALTAERSYTYVGALAGSDHILDSVEAKRKLAARTTALAVDMESHAMAKSVAGRPFGVLRVILDPADSAIPSSVTAALNRKGSIRPLTLIGGLLRHPRELRPLWALARYNVAASRSLRRAAAAIGRAFGPVQ
jgi:hopanoid-associated phosphorylase